MKNAISESIQTHHQIDRELCGTPARIETGFSRIELLTTAVMAADKKELVHGGFIFGLADYAAMIAVNHPNVVLGSADIKFLKPVKVNELIAAEAKTESVEGKKHVVNVEVYRDKEIVCKGKFVCFTLDKHVLA